MTTKEHLIIGICGLLVIVAFIAAGEAQAQDWTGHVEYPDVINYDLSLTEQQAQWVCEEYTAQRELPCVVVKIDDRVCYGYMDAKGQADSVHCFPMLETKGE